MNDLATGEKRPHPLVGTVVEPYAILDVIAAGGMGVVFKARHMLTDRIVAMKLLPSELARDESNVQRVKLEAKALAQLNHPNIVTTFDFGFTYMQEPFIVMEYVAGQSLKEVLDREVLLPVDRAVKIFLQAVDGMRYAHSAKILHRDLKPHNIMVSDDPEPDHVKILDFGVAKFAEYTQQITRTGEVVGSPLYMSPEQCTGRPTDHRCDIYSIGVMMFETLTGNPPFRGENYISTVHLKCTKLAPNFRDVVPGRVFPERLEMIVLKCLEIEPDKRYANMAELRADLELVAGVVPRVDRAKANQNLNNPSLGSVKQTDNGHKSHTTSGPGEIGWKPSWAGSSNTPNTVSNSADDWSDSIVTGTEPDAWQSPVKSHQSKPSGISGQQPPSPPQSQFQPAQHPGQYSASSGSSATPRVDTWRDMSTPNVADDSWRAPSSPNLSADDWGNVDSHKSTGLTGQWPASPTPNLLKPVTPPAAVQAAPSTTSHIAVTAQPPRQTAAEAARAQDMASLAAAVEASSVGGPLIDSPAAMGPASATPAQPAPGPQSEVITGDHPTVQVGSNTVPVPKPNKDAADSHFVLTWDSKSGPAWSATTAAPQKPRGPTAHATNTRNPIQQPTVELTRNPAQKPVPSQASQVPTPSTPATAQTAPDSPLNVQTQQAGTGSPAAVPQTDNQSSSPPAWAQAPPSGQQPSPWNGTTSGVINPAAAYGWRPADADPEQQQQQQQQSSQPQTPPTNGFQTPPGQQIQNHPTSNPMAPVQPGHQPDGSADIGLTRAGGSPVTQRGQFPPQPPSPQPAPTSPAPFQHSASAPGSSATAPSDHRSEIGLAPQTTGSQPVLHQAGPQSTAIQGHTMDGGEQDLWSELPSSSQSTGTANLQSPDGPEGPWGAAPSPASDNHEAPQPGHWGSQPLPTEAIGEQTVLTTSSPAPQRPSSTPPIAEVGTISGVMENPFQTPQVDAGQLNSPAHQLAQRVSKGLARDPEFNTPDKNGSEFKNYEPVSLAELNAIKTPAAKPVVKTPVDSGLSTMLPPTPPATSIPTPKSKSRFTDADEEPDSSSSARSHSASLRFSTSRGGDDGKKVVLISLVGMAIIAIIATAGYIVYSHSKTENSQTSIQEQPQNDQSSTTALKKPDNGSKPVSSSETEAARSTASDTTATRVEKPIKAVKTAVPSAKRKPAVAVKPKKPKKAKAIAKEPAAAPDVPATPRRRRAYSTYDSYYNN